MLRTDLAERLKAAAHDVLRASETGLDRADDSDILARAVADARTLVTLDGHFGDWVVLPLSRHFGVIRIKAHPATSENIAKVLLPCWGIGHNPSSKTISSSLRQGVFAGS